MDRATADRPGPLERLLRHGDLLLLVWVSLLLLIPHGTTGYLRGDGLHYAAVMKSMVATGEWITPTFGDEPYFNKPPLFFWFGAACFAVLGATNYVARFVGTVPAVALVWATWRLVRAVTDERRAFLAALVLATSSVFVRNSGVPRLDAPLTLTIVAAVGAVVAGERDRRWLPWFGAAVSVGLAVKGPGGLWPVPLVAAWSLVARRAYPWNEPRFWLGFLLLPVCVAPWVLRSWQVHGDAYVRAYFVEDLGATLAGAGASVSPLRKYATDLALEWWPWIPFMVHGAWRAVRKVARGDRSGPEPLALAWCATVAVSVLVVQQPYSRYLIPVLPAAGLLAADSIQTLASAWVERNLRPLLVALASAATLLLAVGPLDPHGREVPDVVRFEPVLRVGEARDPVLLLGTKMSRRAQAAAIFYLDTRVRLVTAEEVAARIAATGRPLPLLVDDTVPLPDPPPGVVYRRLLRGEEHDLVLASPAPPATVGETPR